MLACEHSVAVEGLVQTLLYHIVDNVMHRGSMDAVENGIGRGPLYIALRAMYTPHHASVAVSCASVAGSC